MSELDFNVVLKFHLPTLLVNDIWIHSHSEHQNMDRIVAQILIGLAAFSIKTI